MKYQTLIRTTATLYLLMAVLGCTGKESKEGFLHVDKKVISVAKTVTETRFTVSSTQRWQFSKPNTGAEWITNIAADNGTSDASSITGKNDAFITITTTTNPNNAGRSTKLTLRAINQAGKALTDLTPVTISFTQLGTTHTGNVSVTTQAQVNALRTSLTAGATRIVGNVTIGPEEGESNISDLSPLTAITEITGNLVVRNNPDLPNLMGLNQLRIIGGSFEVRRNGSLTSLGEFPMLASIGSSDGVSIRSSEQDGVSIVLERNYRLRDCCVLTAFLRDATNAVSGKIFINDNNALGCNSTTQVNCDPFLQVGQKVLFVAKTATKSTLEVFSTLRWQLSKPNTGAGWITNIAADGGDSDASSITGENDASITITTTANPNDAGRSTTLTLRAIDQTGKALTDPAPITILFTQLGITTGSITLRSQSSVNALTLPANATAIQGDLIIGSSSDITDLRSLSGITHVTGRIEVERNARLVSLDPLGNLQFIGGSFVMDRNAILTSLGNFSALQSIGGRFEVSVNASLTSLGDFTALQTIGSSFEVSSNNALTSMGDFSALQSIGGDFVMRGGDSEEYKSALTSLGDFSTLQSIGGDFYMSYNYALTSLGNFSTLQSIGGNVELYSNASLTSMGDFPALQNISGSFQVGGFFRTVRDEFYEGNASLTSLGDFSALQSIGGCFSVSYNAALISLGGFPMLASIGSSTDGIYIPSTNSWQDGVSIVVERNGRLQDCCVPTAFLSDTTNAVSGKVFINRNAPGCDSTTEVNCDSFLQVGQKVVFVAKTATEYTLNLFSRQHWQLSKPNTGVEWITNIAADGGNSDASSITGENHAFITITTAVNPNDAGRSTTLTLRAIDQTGKALTDPASITIPFTQLGTARIGDVTLYSQADVNAFPANVTAIQGDLIIGSSSDITDLRPLSGITHVTGRVAVVGNSRLVSLDPLGNLQTIGGSFYVSSNATLTSLGDFPVLQTIGGYFWVDGNAALTSLGGFPMLASIGEQDGVSIVVRDNGRLQDCCVLTTFLSDGTNAVSGKASINNNATGCNNKGEIKPCAGGGSTTKGK